MSTAVLVLHGYTMNGIGLQAALWHLGNRFPPDHRLVFVDAPHVCSAQAVDRFYAQTGLSRPVGPYRTWWDASDDGTEYRGWERGIEAVRAAARDGDDIGLIGFSQGAMVAALAAALSIRGKFPPLKFAVMIAGGKPRAEALLPYFKKPIDVPSLHIWGERDNLSVTSAPALVQCFAATSRHTVTWPGPHAFPTRGFAAQALLAFTASVRTQER